MKKSFSNDFHSEKYIIETNHLKATTYNDFQVYYLILPALKTKYNGFHQSITDRLHPSKAWHPLAKSRESTQNMEKKDLDEKERTNVISRGLHSCINRKIFDHNSFFQSK